MEKIKNYINGELVEPFSKTYIDNYNPSIGEVYSLIPDSDEEDVDLATKAAKAAFPAWSKTPKEKRARILQKLASLIEDNLDRFAEAESRDNGKPLSLAKRVDIPRAAANFNFYATGVLHYASEAHQMEDTAINYTTREPIGVCGCISPWNLPLYLFSWKIAPALAIGNTVVAKPSEVTPYTAYLLSELCIEAGLPKGVLNIVHGLGHKVGAAITKHTDIPVISFTGGTVTGAEIARVAGPMFKKLSLELGGKNPNIIFDDCDFEKALGTTMHSSFANQGQICLCGSRIFVQRGLYEKFRDAFVAKTKKLTVGNPFDEGGTVLTGGHQVKLDGEQENGWYIAPTIIEGLSFDCRTNQEEIFGPVVTIMPFDTMEEVLAMANSTKYGLASTVWTQDITKAHNVAAQLHSGIVWVNTWLLRDLRTPFGGVKASGVGREGGFNAFEFFTEPKNVCIKL
jgi:aminomuconate-semialdehyde/2-hydroxymuconate-6-semialdehyde dehydrogenase